MYIVGETSILVGKYQKNHQLMEVLLGFFFKSGEAHIQLGSPARGLGWPGFLAIPESAWTVGGWANPLEMIDYTPLCHLSWGLIFEKTWKHLQKMGGVHLVYLT